MWYSGNRSDGRILAAAKPDRRQGTDDTRRSDAAQFGDACPAAGGHCGREAVIISQRQGNYCEAATQQEATNVLMPVLLLPPQTGS